MPHVMGDNLLHTAFHRQMNHHFIVRIGQHRPPARTEPLFLGAETQSIQQPLNLLIRVR